jgi:S1-C subfamily serine protease
MKIHDLLNADERAELAAIAPRRRFAGPVLTFALLALVAIALAVIYEEASKDLRSEIERQSVSSFGATENGETVYSPLLAMPLPVPPGLGDSLATAVVQTVFLRTFAGLNADGKPVLAYGNGLLVSDGLVATVAHLASGSVTREFEVICHGHAQRGKLLMSDEEFDLALVYAPKCRGQGIEVSPLAATPDAPPPGLNVWVSGFSFDGRQLAVGRLLRPTTRELPPLMRFSAAVNPRVPSGVAKIMAGQATVGAINVALPRGWSGSAVLDDQGRLLGFVSVMKPRGETYFVSAKHLTEAVFVYGQ